MVALGGGHTEQLDEATAALAMCIRGAMTRLATEIPRTTNYFRSQHGGSAPKKVYLAGGGAYLPYTKEFLEEKLKLPVEYFNPLPAITVDPAVDAERLSSEAHTIGELIGLGLRCRGKSRLNIDLVPAKVGEARAAEKRRPFFVAAAVLLVAGALAGGFFKSQAAKRAELEADEMQRIANELQGPARGIDLQLQKEARLKEIAALYTDAEVSRVFWIDVYRELSAAFASEFVWFTDLEPVASYDPFAEDPMDTMKSLITNDFPDLSLGDPALKDVKLKSDPIPRMPNRFNAGAPAPGPVYAKANALHIRGFWLNSSSNRRGQNVVYDLLERLQENASEGHSHFKFSMSKAPAEGQWGATAEEVELENSQLVPKIDAAPKEGEYASAFELVLPLNHPIEYR
jgi:hypothetical protein